MSPTPRGTACGRHLGGAISRKTAVILPTWFGFTKAQLKTADETQKQAAWFCRTRVAIWWSGLPKETMMPSRRIDLDELRHVLREHAVGRRLIVALAGPPGSGKSTSSELLVESLNADVAGWAAVLPMDGFHYDDLYLTPAGLRPRKGAPDRSEQRNGRRPGRRIDIQRTPPFFGRAALPDLDKCAPRYTRPHGRREPRQAVRRRHDKLVAPVAPAAVNDEAPTFAHGLRTATDD